MLACSKYKGFSKSLYKMSSAGKNRSFSISVTRESSTFILQYIVVLISTTEPENMSPQLHLGVKLSPMLVFGSRNCVQAAIPIVIYYRNRRLDAVLGAKNQPRRQLHVQVELGAHILGFGSTNEYYDIL